ncbi:hypothetical protein HCB37_11125 [Listeria booriae]|uniref:hypothetical protein n=1 Tax=Listeria booriae TaxID=1552123 RepID=UPI00162620BD|nr:hypothetical protein [Listeria booriae]MBC2265066.1 hypothetical protein [Listeria booriae]
MPLDKTISMNPEELIGFSNTINKIMNDFIENVAQYATKLQFLDIYEDGAAKETMEAYFNAISKTTEILVHYQALKTMLDEIRANMQAQDVELATKFGLEIESYDWMAP